ncbi:DUF4192 domain-containing protein [Micromonospora echinofusca]|uniref:DUF4192 family protein n=1 Tax=Micromonospora echinofusca TaxID=47858 RepID=A0ABS3VZ32_MICEH|nr:DUF4192 domain-containing protein [Micromonospora echinofusca]MBO4209795.1 DUF4192 family protein [Micromonospora echinofusca]
MSFADHTLTIRSSADLVAVVPYLIGFHPGDGSIVVIAFRDSRVVFAARGDIPAPGTPAHQLRAFTDDLVAVVQRQQPVTAVVITGHGQARHVDPALRLFGEVFTAGGTPVRDLLRVTDGRFFSLSCDNSTCCPPEGTPFDPTTALVAVQATVAGLVARADRAAVAARITPVGGVARDSIRRATGQAATRLESLIATGSEAVGAAGTLAVRDALRQHDSGTRLTDDELAWLTVLLTRTAVRDRAAELTEPHDGHVTFWVDVVRRAHAPLVPAPATLLALTAWRCGDGVLAGMAAERALQIDPAYRLAGLLLHALHAGLPPSLFEQASIDDRPDLPSDPRADQR